MESADQTLIRRIHDYERLAGILWIAIGVLQILALCGLFVFGIPTMLVGIWNIFAGISHLKIAPRILARESSIPAQFESMNSLIIIGICNLLLGGVVGVLFVILDFYIRDQILANRQLFIAAPSVP